MRTTWTCRAMSSPAARTWCSVAPAASARVPAAWMTGPSARGSEKGTPSSTRSAPASAYASPIRTDSSAVGKPPMRYGMSVALPLAGAGAERPGDGVGGLERGDDALELGEPPERRQRLCVGHGDVARAARVAQVRVLRPRARVVEAGGDRVRLE